MKNNDQPFLTEVQQLRPTALRVSNEGVPSQTIGIITREAA
jgi:hypothetical protein